MTRANLQLTDYVIADRPRSADLEKVSAPLSRLLTLELDGAAATLGIVTDELLVAALGRAIERAIGCGTVAVDVPGYGTSVHPVALACAGPAQVDADEMLAGVHHALETLTIRRIVHGVPTHPEALLVSKVLFASDASAVTRAHQGHVLELRAYRDGDVMALDWWFDRRSFEPYTVEELAEQFPLALIELTSEATPTLLTTAELALAY